MKAAIWAHRINKDWEVVSFPRECNGCSTEEKELYGCGFEKEYKGKAKVQFNFTNGEEPYTKTCPQYFVRLDDVQNILSYLQDYKKGAIGNIFELPTTFLEYLKIAEYERQEWERENEKALRKK